MTPKDLACPPRIRTTIIRRQRKLQMFIVNRKSKGSQTLKLAITPRKKLTSYKQNEDNLNHSEKINKNFIPF